jgi:hypothetical protein
MFSSLTNQPHIKPKIMYRNLFSKYSLAAKDGMLLYTLYLQK